MENKLDFFFLFVCLYSLLSKSNVKNMYPKIPHSKDTHFNKKKKKGNEMNSTK